MTRYEEALLMLEQLNRMLMHCERAGEDRMPTMRSFLMVARAVYWLIERWAKEHGQKQYPYSYEYYRTDEPNTVSVYAAPGGAPTVTWEKGSEDATNRCRCADEMA